MGISEKGIPLGIWNSTAGESLRLDIRLELTPFRDFARIRNTAN